MSERRSCPVPLCTCRLPDGANAVFCVDHYFMVPKKEMDLIFATKIACTRATDDGTRKYLEEQVQGYVSAAITRFLTPGNADAA